MRVPEIRRHAARTASAMAGVGVVVLALASVWAQPPGRATRQPRGETRKPAPVARELRYAPTLAIVLVAYEGLLQNNEKANPEAVRALKQSFARNPSARQTIDKLYRAYRAMTPADRAKVVGPELARATADTRLSRALLEPILAKHFRPRPVMRAEQLPTAVNPAQMRPVEVDARAAPEEAAALVVDQPVPFRERLIGIEPREGHSTTYRVEYTGLYCAREPLDWGAHCEPAVVFVMQQADAPDPEWTRSFGPYEKCDSGDSFPERRWLRHQTPFDRDLHIAATLIEHDVGSLDEIGDAIQSAVDVIAAVVGIWVDVPTAMSNAIADALTWLADVLGFSHDQIGEPQMIAISRGFAERHTRHNSSEGIEYDTFLRFTGPRHPLRRHGDFYVFLDVRVYP
ncbi:MAG: hypothetical protein U0835_10905 [Isosphaeraceae bacterium]